jgi:hypothetical protein
MFSNYFDRDSFWTPKKTSEEKEENKKKIENLKIRRQRVRTA